MSLLDLLEHRVKVLESKLLKTESKQVGTLYHVCTLSAYLDYIYPNDTLSASGKYVNWLYGSNTYVSFTRDRRFVVQTDDVQDSDILVQLVIDGDKLSEKYKIGPYNDFAYDHDGNETDDSELIKYREKEEVVRGPIKNISKYIKNIYVDAKDINKHSIEDLKDLTELNPNAKYFDFIIGKDSAFGNFIKSCGLENGDPVKDCLIVFTEYYYTVMNNLFSGDIRKIEMAMWAMEDDSSKINKVYGDKGTLLNYYCNSDKNASIVKLLLKYGADANVQNNNGDTALIIAARSGSPEIVKLILKAGVYRGEINDKGETAFDVAATPYIKELLDKKK